MVFAQVVNCAWLHELPQRFECLAIVLWKIGDITNSAKVCKPVAILSLPFLHCTVGVAHCYILKIDLYYNSYTLYVHNNNNNVLYHDKDIHTKCTYLKNSAAFIINP